ncbi:hypothetical protein LTR53_014794 [Teratosphaeriaceae sp. CCFEE 6253]|nr:hypothetical protein LTR53_014794 [Teratosphaeriaceae sp. CCFEE 6253]
MTDQRKSILAGTFGPYVKQDSALIESYGGEENIKKMIMASVRQANEAGFDVDNIAFSKEPEDSIKRLEGKLRSQQWDGFLIGWGVRGNKDSTALFEAAVNTARKVAPQTTLLFGNAPDDLSNTLQRNFDVSV